MKVVVEHFSDSRWSWFQTETDDPDSLSKKLGEEHPEWQAIRVSSKWEYFKRWNYPIQETMGGSIKPTLH